MEKRGQKEKRSTFWTRESQKHFGTKLENTNSTSICHNPCKLLISSSGQQAKTNIYNIISHW